MTATELTDKGFKHLFKTSDTGGTQFVFTKILRIKLLLKLTHFVSGLYSRQRLEFKHKLRGSVHSRG